MFRGRSCFHTFADVRINPKPSHFLRLLLHAPALIRHCSRSASRSVPAPGNGIPGVYVL